MSVHETARANMIESQLRPNRVTDERVIEAFSRLRRELFVPAHLRGVAYVDEDLPLGRGRYLMEPMVAARLLQAAMVEAKDTVLVVGAGVGGIEQRCVDRVLPRHQHDEHPEVFAPQLAIQPTDVAHGRCVGRRKMKRDSLLR